ncbi:sensor histidine kinase [Streptomyces sp. GS7]|uniref:sensor histidine kinase n=1 Tax=Streptomyces sp. GS7 TaxID=2692234 RepID=UPI0013160F7B|nr:histidine kinase [Streptomyces sp. GS7]QHC25640.1 sensor histidine kinase [Streptomyces sp. GS7]
MPSDSRPEPTARNRPASTGSASRHLPGAHAEVWAMVLLRPVALAAVVAVLVAQHRFRWSAAHLAGFVLLAVVWLVWSVLAARAAFALELVPRRTAAVLLAPAVLSGSVLLAAAPGAEPIAVLVVLAVIAAGADLPMVISVGVLACGALALAAGTALGPQPAHTEVLEVWSAVLLAAYLGGVTRRSIRVQHLQSRRLLAETQEAQEERQRAAALAERARLAREIHDVLAHSLGALVIQLEVIESLLAADPADVAQAAERAGGARQIAKDGLTETRRAIAALRTDTPPLPEALASLAAGHHSAAGGAAEFQVHGTPRPLEAEASLALLRVAQEALANAAKHAPGRPVRMTLEYAEQRVRLTVVSHGPVGAPAPPTPDAAQPPTVGGMSGGYGLAGMRERLLLVGGELTVGPCPQGWRVMAEVAA